MILNLLQSKIFDFNKIIEINIFILAKRMIDYEQQ